MSKINITAGVARTLSNCINENELEEAIEKTVAAVVNSLNVTEQTAVKMLQQYYFNNL